MGFLQDRKILVTGMLSNRSIAYGIAGACRREGAELAFTYQGEGVRERVLELAAEFGTDRVYPCDVADDAQITEIRGRANALAGHRAEAIGDAERSLALRETSLDATSGPYYRFQLTSVRSVSSSR